MDDKEILHNLQEINEYKFEQLVADVWEHLGWDTTVTSGSNDRGIDVIAEKSTPFHQKQILQAKRYSSNNIIGSPDIQQYGSLKQQIQGVDTVVIVTTSDFSSKAKDAAAALNVKTINGKTFSKLIRDTCNTEINKKYFQIHENNKKSKRLSCKKEGYLTRKIRELFTQKERDNYEYTKFEDYHDEFCLDIYVEYEAEVVTYQLTSKGIHNVPQLDIEQVENLKKIISNHNYAVINEITFPESSTVSFTSNEPKEDINIEEIEAVIEDILIQVYNSTKDDICDTKIFDL